jgi:hypothetical protein
MYDKRHYIIVFTFNFKQKYKIYFYIKYINVVSFHLKHYRFFILSLSFLVFVPSFLFSIFFAKRYTYFSSIANTKIVYAIVMQTERAQ